MAYQDQDDTLEALTIARRMYPGLRIGQILENAVACEARLKHYMCDGHADFFYIPDTLLTRAIYSFIGQERHKELEREFAK